MKRSTWTPLRKLLERALRRVVMLEDPHEAVVELKPRGPVNGHVLLSYVLDPFLLDDVGDISNAHTHHWESWRIAESFLVRGYQVDVISYRNARFEPGKKYTVLFGARTNFQRLCNRVGTRCRKVVHLDTAHWLYNNTAAYRRLLALQDRRGVTLYNTKMVETNYAVENADMCTVLGNAFTMDTYRYAGKPLYRIPISAPRTYDYPDDRDLESARKHFLWFGSSGFVHKGLDIVLEAFSAMPEFHLHVCGPFADEPAFVKAYDRELFHTSNIHAEGWVDVASARFTDLCRQSIGVVYPSASEGGGGSVISCMHAGLIPLVSAQASVDIGTFGLDLGAGSVEAVQETVRKLSERGSGELDRRARAAWLHAREHHTRETFGSAFDHFVDEVLLA